MRGSMAGDDDLGRSGTNPSDPFVRGQRIDRYEIREHVGQGGMGAVYRAVDTKLGRTVALKTVAAHRRGDKLTEEIRERFMREALAASRVDHRNVVQVLDFGFSDDGTPYMVMEFLRGRSLGEWLKAAKGPMAIDSVADIMLSVCAALRACHHVGIIHRDLKPANIFLCDTDTGWEIKVLDFGISKAPAAEVLTEDGQIIGTPQYLSPEQIEGAVGPESDQYALGVLIYLCLTQRLPFAGHKGARLLDAIAEGKFAPPRTLRPDLPEGLEAIVLRAMHLAPAQRFESIYALGQRLWEFASARGQGQWKTFYFHTPPAAHVARPSTYTNDAELRAIPRARPPVEAPAVTPDAPRPRVAGPAGGKARVDSTASLAPRAEVAKTEPASQATIGPGAFAATKTAAAGVPDGTSLSQSDIAGESALSAVAERGRASRGARLGIAFAIAALAGVAIVAARRSWHAGPPAAEAPAEPVVVPAAPAPLPPPPPPRVQEEPSAPPTPPATAAPASKEPGPRDLLRKKRATKHHPMPKLDQHGIGIPTE